MHIMTEPRTIAEFAKNNSETIRVGLVEYGGHRLCDIRILAGHTSSQGDRRPTKKGICLQVSLLAELITALQDAQRESSR